MGDQQQTPLQLIESEGKNIFNGEDSYIIPIYQRAFAWEKEEIEQLIDDIADFKGKNYFLGSLIVSKREDEKFEVVDGQQRLTALYILLSVLGQELNDNALSFECREKSTNTLKHLNYNRYTNNDNIKLEQSIINGKEIVKIKLKTDEFRKSLKAKSVQTVLQLGSDDDIQIAIRNYFVEQLKKVSLFRIELPANTDLNRYFEIMNTRGEQLEATDILKARLMEELDDGAERSAFAKIWDACRDMTGYVQMHFKTAERKLLFGEEWDNLSLIEMNWVKIAKDPITETANSNQNGNIMDGIINGNKNDDAIQTSNNNTSHYKSIITFPVFLLHVLNEYKSNISGMTDEKKLLDEFSSVTEKNFSREFICRLLKLRYLFDKYIVKREYESEESEESEGKWSLNSSSLGEENQKLLQIQSCLRVTDTSPKSMHWITELLIWLDKNTNNGILSDGKEYLKEIELFVKKRVNEIIKDENVWNKGTGTPRLLFNYLDYLLWEKYFKSTEKERSNYKDYTFKFANSVEHWYPQNPSEDGIALWDKDNGEGLSVNNFGNLCLVTTKVNSEFSNRSPESKSKEFEGKIADCSLKLREMSKKTKESDGKWGFPLGNEESPCKKHMDEMIQLIDESLKGIKEMNWTVAAIASVVAEPQ